MQVRAGVSGLLAGLALAVAPPVAAACRVDEVLHLPVIMEGQQPLVDAKVENHAARFLIDTGSFYSIIARPRALAFGLRLEASPDEVRIRGIGGVADTSATVVRKFSLGGVTLPNVFFLVTDGHFDADGVIGQNVLSVYDVEYDFAGGSIRLMRPHGCSDTIMAYWAGEKPISTVPIDRVGPDNPQIVSVAYLNGAKIKVVLDSGAELSILSDAVAARAGFTADGPGVKPAGSVVGIGRRKIPTFVARFSSFKIGDEEIRGARLRFGKLINPDFDMLLGADFFRSHRLYVANAGGKIYFTYNGGPVFDLVDKPESRAAP